MRVVFFGSSRYAVPVIEMLYNNFDLPLVVTTEQNKADPVPFFCEAKKIEYLIVRKSADMLSSYQISESLASLGVVADFGLIIPQKTINYFSYGMVNIHPSLLPKYRGPSPVQDAILNGERETGVTIIKLDKYLDHGPVVGQVKEEIKSDDTSQSLYERLFKIGATLLEKEIPRFEEGAVKLIPQNHDHATFTKQLTREDGYVDFENFFSSKEFFDRLIKAYYPWPGVWTKINVSDDKKDLKVVKFTPVKKVQVEGGREMTYKDFINGYPKANKNLIEFLKKDI